MTWLELQYRLNKMSWEQLNDGVAIQTEDGEFLGMYFLRKTIEDDVLPENSFYLTNEEE